MLKSFSHDCLPFAYLFGYSFFFVRSCSRTAEQNHLTYLLNRPASRIIGLRHFLSCRLLSPLRRKTQISWTISAALLSLSYEQCFDENEVSFETTIAESRSPFADFHSSSEVTRRTTWYERKKKCDVKQTHTIETNEKQMMDDQFLQY